MINLLLFCLIITIVNAQGENNKEENHILPSAAQTRSISTCWLLTIFDNANESETFDSLLETLQAQNLTQNEALHGIQLKMIKQCFKIITEAQIQKIMDSVNIEDVQLLQYRAIVKDFEYSTYIEELRLENIKKSEGTYTQFKVDEVIMMMINRLEKQQRLANNKANKVSADISQDGFETKADL